MKNKDDFSKIFKLPPALKKDRLIEDCLKNGVSIISDDEINPLSIFSKTAPESILKERLWKYRFRKITMYLLFLNITIAVLDIFDFAIRLFD